MNIEIINKIGYSKILITGEPGCGKSTLLWDVIQGISQKSGILTKQILDDGKRIGFEVETNEGKLYPLSSTVHKEWCNQFGRYYIKQDSLSDIIKNFASELGDLLYLDEIGPMQLATSGFVEFADSLLGDKNFLIGVIKQNDELYPYIQEVKKRKDVLLLTLNDTNKEEIQLFLSQLKKKIIKSQQYILEPDRYQKVNEHYIIMQSNSNTRNIKNIGGILLCDCGFYTKYGTCSHTIALRQISNQII